MVQFPEADARKFHNVFVCKQCGSKIRSSNMKILQGKVRCRKCGSRVLRPKRKK